MWCVCPCDCNRAHCDCDCDCECYIGDSGGLGASGYEGVEEQEFEWTERAREKRAGEKAGGRRCLVGLGRPAIRQSPCTQRQRSSGLVHPASPGPPSFTASGPVPETAFEHQAARRDAACPVVRNSSIPTDRPTYVRPRRLAELEALLEPADLTMAFSFQQRARPSGRTIGRIGKKADSRAIGRAIFLGISLFGPPRSNLDGCLEIGRASGELPVHKITNW